MSENKVELRLLIRQRRHCMSPESRERSSALLLQRLLQWPLIHQVQHLGCFLPLADEIETRPILEWAWAHGKNVAVPHWDEEADAYQYVLLEPDTEIRLGAFGVREAVDAIPIPIRSLEMLLLPGQAFDDAGHRLGRGKGHIDRMLAPYRGLRVGLCFEWQHLPTIPQEAHDIPMHAVFTQEGPLTDPKHLVLGGNSESVQY